ncbi:hypothetical protein, partial [Micromonospora sp. NPDC048830]|uniref:hypothetical protein n=1 Tax=Micromonospora sp. NPDC048830 TaxID=3364257 RepID=UPI003722D04F
MVQDVELGEAAAPLRTGDRAGRPAKLAGGWTEGEPPELTGGYTKEVKVDRIGRLTFTLDGKPPIVGAAVAGQEATVWFGPRTDGSPEGEAAAWIKIESREGGPVWRWLVPAPTKEDLERLEYYEPRTAHAGEWTEGNPPKVTGGDTKKIRIDRQGRLTVTVGGKKPGVGAAVAGQEATVWFGPRTDGSPEGEAAAWVKIESREGGPVWRWLVPAPTKEDLKRLQAYRIVRAGEWTEGDPPELTGGYTKEVKLNRQGRLPFTVAGNTPRVGAAAAYGKATVWFGPRTDGSPEGEAAAWIKVKILKDREGGPFWRWLDPAPTKKDLKRLEAYENRDVDAGEWTAGDPPQLTDGYTKEVPIDLQGQLPFPVGGTPGVGVAAAGQMATVWFGPRPDGSPEGELAGWIKVKGLEGREGGPFWLWLDPAPTKKDLKRLESYENRDVDAGEWTAGDPPQLTDGYTKEVPIDPQGQLPFPVGGTPGVGVAAAGQMATVWFGPRTDGSHAGELAGWIKVKGLEGREGGPFWLWLDPAPTKKDLKRLRTYEPRTAHAGEWTKGDPPEPTGGYTKEVPIDLQGQLPFTVGRKRPVVGWVAADRMATVWFGPRTDGSPEGEAAAWIKVKGLDGRESSRFWRWLDPAPTKKDLKRLRAYENRDVRANEWTKGDPPRLPGGYTKEVRISRQGRLPFPVGGTPGVGSVAADQMATVWFGPRTDGSPEGELAGWIKVESLYGRKDGPFWLWLDPAPTKKDLERLQAYEPRTAHAGEWTAGNPPKLTDGYTREVKLDLQGQLPFTVGGKRVVGAVAADQMATVWFGPRTDGSPEGELAGWIKVKGLKGRKGGLFWRWLDPAPTEEDLQNLKKYTPRTMHAGRWT